MNKLTPEEKDEMIALLFKSLDNTLEAKGAYFIGDAEFYRLCDLREKYNDDQENNLSSEPKPEGIVVSSDLPDGIDRV